MLTERQTPPAFDYDSFDLPENVSMTFHLGHHYDALDLPESSVLSKTLREADIVIPEFVHDISAKNIMAAIAMGRPREYQNFRAALRGNEMVGWLSAFASSLYDTKTATANVDVLDTHPSVIAFDRTEPGVRRAAEWPVRERFGDIIPLFQANLAALMQRDQAILKNIRPEVETAIANNYRLMKAREGRPLNVHLFYGAMHTSLFDAIRFKQQLEPTAGLTVDKSSDSIEGEFGERIYADFLRGHEISVDDVERHFSYLVFASHLDRLGLMRGKFSSRELQGFFTQISGLLDVSDPRDIPTQVDELIRAGLLGELRAHG